MSKKFLVIIVNLVVILFVAFWLMKEIDNFKGLKDVVVAKANITKGTKITNDMLMKKKVTLNQEGKDSGDLVKYYGDSFENFSDIVDKYAKYDFVQGEIILAAKLSKDFVFGDEFLYKMPKGYYPVAVPIGEAAGTAGLIRVNDYIDFYLTRGNEPIEEPALRHLKVYDLRCGDGTSATQNKVTNQDGTEQIRMPAAAIVALNDYQVKKYLTTRASGITLTPLIRKRTDKVYEVYDYQDVDYPAYGNEEGQVIDSVKEQELIEQYRLKMESEQIEEDLTNGTNNGVNNTSGTTGLPTNNSANPSMGTGTTTTNPTTGTTTGNNTTSGTNSGTGTTTAGTTTGTNTATGTNSGTGTATNNPVTPTR